MPDFEIFERKNARASKGPTLTITVRGTLNLNGPAYALLGKPEAVVLLYARADRVIGLRPASRDEQNAYLVRPLGKSGNSWTVVATEFSAWIEADLSAARRYPLEAEPDGVCFVRLSGPVKVVAGNRNRAAAVRVSDGIVAGAAGNAASHRRSPQPNPAAARP